MLNPTNDGEFESWSTLSETLVPFLTDQVGALFCPWTVANAAALAAGDEEFSVDLAGQTFTQQPQKYHAKSLQVIRQRYAEVAEKAELDPVLAATGCLEAVQS